MEKIKELPEVQEMKRSCIALFAEVPEAVGVANKDIFDKMITAIENHFQLATSAQAPIDSFIATINNDQSEGSVYYAWQSNIAMSFFDECRDRGSEMDTKELHELCNAGAKRFLNLLIGVNVGVLKAY